MLTTTLLASVVTSAGAIATPPPDPAVFDKNLQTAQIFSLVVRQRPNHGLWFTPAEFEAMASRYAVAAGLDGHGYNFPGPVGSLKALNPDVIALAHWDAMTVGIGDDRYRPSDIHESIFIHSAEPACLVPAVDDGVTKIWFRQDSRARLLNFTYVPPGVIEYLVEYAPTEDGPWTQLGSPINEYGAKIYTITDPVVDPNRFYRVRSRLGDGSLVDYSWPVAIDASATTTLAAGYINTGGAMHVRCYGDCPEDPADLRIDADLDNSHTFSFGERFYFDTLTTLLDGSKVYTGTLDSPIADFLYNYRIVLETDPAVTEPREGAYQRGDINNRIQMRSFGSAYIWPNNTIWMNQTIQRLTDALAIGYDGIRLDFTFDSMDLFWAATGEPLNYSPGDTVIRDQMIELLTALKAAHPTALVSINGLFTVVDPANFDTFTDIVDIGEVEFFAIGNDRASPELQTNTGQGMQAVFDLRAKDRMILLDSGVNVANLLGRMRTFGLYLLVSGEGVFFYTQTDNFLNDVVYLPEWDVQLGDAVREVTSFADLADSRDPALLSREFERGWVLFNNSGDPVTIDLGEELWSLSMTGGLHEIVGGDGQAIYTPVTEVTLGAAEVAILVRTTQPCPGDLYVTGDIGAADLAFLLGYWSAAAGDAPPGTDLDGDGVIGAGDLADLIGRWGPCP